MFASLYVFTCVCVPVFMTVSLCVFVFVCLLRGCTNLYVPVCLCVCVWLSVHLCHYVFWDENGYESVLLSYALSTEFEIKDVINLDNVNAKSRLVVSGIVIKVKILNVDFLEICFNCNDKTNIMCSFVYWFWWLNYYIVFCLKWI